MDNYRDQLSIDPSSVIEDQVKLICQYCYRAITMDKSLLRLTNNLRFSNPLLPSSNLEEIWSQGDATSIDFSNRIPIRKPRSRASSLLNRDERSKYSPRSPSSDDTPIIEVPKQTFSEVSNHTISSSISPPPPPQQQTNPPSSNLVPLISRKEMIKVTPPSLLLQSSRIPKTKVSLTPPEPLHAVISQGQFKKSLNQSFNSNDYSGSRYATGGSAGIGTASGIVVSGSSAKVSGSQPSSLSASQISSSTKSNLIPVTQAPPSSNMNTSSVGNSNSSGGNTLTNPNHNSTIQHKSSLVQHIPINIPAPTSSITNANANQPSAPSLSSTPESTKLTLPNIGLHNNNPNGTSTALSHSVDEEEWSFLQDDASTFASAPTGPTDEDILSDLLLHSVAAYELEWPLCSTCAPRYLDKILLELEDAEEQLADLNHYLNTFPSAETMNQIFGDDQHNTAMQSLKSQNKSVTEKLDMMLIQNSLQVQCIESHRLQNERLQLLLDDYWNRYTSFLHDRQYLTEYYGKVQSDLKSSFKLRETLCQSCALNDSFHIDSLGHYATINNLRLGRSSPSLNSLVSWDETSAAFGFLAVLVAKLATSVGHEWSKSEWRIHTEGSFCALRQNGGEPNYLLYVDPDAIVLGKWLAQRAFDQGFEAFFACILEIVATVISKRDSSFKLPFSMAKKGKSDFFINDEKLVKAKDDPIVWTHQVKYIAINIKMMLSHLIASGDVK